MPYIARAVDKRGKPIDLDAFVRTRPDDLISQIIRASHEYTRRRRYIQLLSYTGDETGTWDNEDAIANRLAAFEMETGFVLGNVATQQLTIFFREPLISIVHIAQDSTNLFGITDSARQDAQVLVAIASTLHGQRLVSAPVVPQPTILKAERVHP
jgi:hypothetical protein